MKPILFSAALVGVATTALFGAADRTEPQTGPPVPLSVKVTKQVQPYFPARLYRQGVLDGEAVLAIQLDPAGKLSDYLVARYTHQEFATAAVDAIKQWKFELSTPVGAVMEVIFVFRRDGVLAVERFGGDPPLERWADGGYTYQPCTANELDHAPKPKHLVSPDYPPSLERNGVVGSVLINFYIDEQGRARLPVPASQENPTLGSLATAAVEQWQFEPPTRQGKPVLVRATQRFLFASNK